MLTAQEALQRIEKSEALLAGHFVLVSGRHSDRYVSKDLVSTLPHILAELASSISGHFRVGGVQVVAAPAVGAIALGNRVAEHLGPEVRAVYAEQQGDEFVFGRGFSRFIGPGVRILVAEDIRTTGKTTGAMVRAVQKLGGEVVGVGLLWDRSQEAASDIPVFACVTQTLPTYGEEECPLCKEGVWIDTEVNKHGGEFLQAHGTDPSGWPANRAA